MARRADITSSHEWFRFEAKNIDIRVLDSAGDAVDLTSLDLEWTVRRTAGSASAVLTVTPSAVAHSSDTGGVKSVARCAVATGDYGSLTAGVWHHELWDRGNDVLLAYGDVHLREASEEASP